MLVFAFMKATLLISLYPGKCQSWRREQWLFLLKNYPLRSLHCLTIYFYYAKQRNVRLYYYLLMGVLAGDNDVAGIFKSWKNEQNK